MTTKMIKDKLFACNTIIKAGKRRESQLKEKIQACLCPENICSDPDSHQILAKICTDAVSNNQTPEIIRQLILASISKNSAGKSCPSSADIDVLVNHLVAEIRNQSLKFSSKEKCV
jgi:hypothetical protein